MYVIIMPKDTPESGMHRIAQCKKCFFSLQTPSNLMYRKTSIFSKIIPLMFEYGFTPLIALG